MRPIGVVRSGQARPPRHWSVSQVEGVLEVLPRYREGLVDIRAGERIVVLFVFHRSPRFGRHHLRVIPPTRNELRGVFSTCSPVRPNPIGLSVLEVLSVEGCRVRVRGLDMLDGTPILDIKPHKV
ncbi:MAG: tRNA (N6-threonylcarbamoyladenosine(37)-N6)-methyltransferase TrmO [Spirochaetales bacterium]|nr:tRNA (N6-threonylcarbamoyladenosine(37)-N6)-methyltransferase TrmO [Spirochaetales bacterium]